ncbi:MAG: PAS domain S-box protein, partial [candidate division WOR-3 bacterium]|nr:PAS domain S-box protein [candidate division WOR-3 bacterium]
MPVKMWQGWSSVQTRLTLVMLAAATVAALVLVVSGKSETRKMDAYLAADAKEDGELLDRTLELEGGSLATFAKDYTNWGEMVRFVETGDRTWASVNIDDVLTTYRADAAWVFDAAGSPVYAVRDSTLEALLKPLPPGLSVKDEFGDGHFCHFFIAGPDGPVEIRGATIHPSEDDERKTPVRGYFLAARSWNRQYLTELTRLTGKTIRVEPTHGRTKPSTEIARQLGEIKFIRPLPGPEGKPELMLTALLRPEWIAVARRSSRDLSVQMAALALLGVLGLTMALWLWVTRPLGQIRRSLESGTSEALKPLERSRTEFGQLAQLVDQSFGQNAAQVKEVTERKQAEQTLHESEERFRELFESMSSGVAVYETRDRGASFIFTNLNRGAERIDSLRREEVVGRYVQQVFPGIEEFGLLAVLRRVWQTGKPEQHPVGHYEDDRISGWRENYVYKLPSGEVVAVYDDVTARIEAEVALRKNEARLQEAQTLGRTGNWEFDLDSQKLEWSDETYRLYERDKPLGPPTLEEEASYYSPEEVLRLRGFARQATEEGRDISYDLTANLPSGRTVFFSARMHPVKDETGRVVKLFGTIHDITERKQAEAGLRESAEKYRLVVDNADEAILVAQDGKLVFTNPRTNQMTGYTREELLGRSFVEFIHPDDRALVADRYRRRIAGEDIPVGYDFRIVRRDGETRHVEINATRIDWMGRPATLNFLADITERKQAEEALRESEARMRTITGSAKDAIIMMDDSGLVTFWNPAAEAMFGYAAEDVIGRKLHEFLTPERFRAAHAAAFGQFRATGEGGAVGKTVELAATRKDGTEVPAELSLSAIKIGDKWHGVGIVRDISERKRGEAVLRETNAYLDNLIAHANAPIIVWDPDFRITRFNRAFERLTGRRESDVKGQTLDILFPASRREDSLSLIHRTATGERWETVEIAIQHVNGSVFTVLWNSATLYTPTGSVLATIAQGQDITERQ